jgi:hypothetical protein
MIVVVDVVVVVCTGAANVVMLAVVVCSRCCGPPGMCESGSCVAILNVSPTFNRQPAVVFRTIVLQLVCVRAQCLVRARGVA